MFLLCGTSIVYYESLMISLNKSTSFESAKAVIVTSIIGFEDRSDESLIYNGFTFDALSAYRELLMTFVYS